MGEGGSVHGKAAPEVAASMRRLLAAIDAGELSCSKGYRRQLQGAVVALEAMAGCGQADAVGSRSSVSDSSATVDRRGVTPKASAMADRAGKDFAMTEPQDPPHDDTELDSESSIDEPTAEANSEAGEDDVASGHRESGDTY
ncbi:MAG TPA: hypothetical protein VE645_13875 [Pseudonocardiaceae bacterium]|nr:hypothetical protein [Pseudonocardiaceae bacterium]